jgi:hypothetical protein
MSASSPVVRIRDCAAGGGDGPGDAARPLLSKAVDDVGKPGLAHPIHHFGRGSPPFIHAHVERSVGLKLNPRRVA